MDLDKSLEFANAKGALCITVRSDVEAIPSVGDVKRFLDGGEHILR
jgi:sugar/nucleoside kinase (ribokinase family)